MSRSAGVRLATLAALTIVLVLAGCGPSVTEGTVTHKDYSPSHVATSTVCVPNANGCTPTVTTTYIPESWSLVIDPPDGKPASVSVTAEQWYAVEVGDYWTRSS